MSDFLECFNHPLSVIQYFQLIEAGAIRERDPIYLWKGRLVQRTKEERPHSFSLTTLRECMGRVTPNGWHVEQGQPLAVGDDSAPEPDLSVIRGSCRDYPRLPPTAQDVTLLVEVSANRLSLDLGEMLEAYAIHAIPTYWIVNLHAHRVEVRTEPTGPVERPCYRVVQMYGPDDEVPVLIDGHEICKIAVRDFLP